MIDEITSEVFKLGEWVRLIVTIISLVIVGYILWRTRFEKAKDDTIRALQNAVDAHKAECAALQLRLETIGADKLRLEGECSVLKTRTDITEVVKTLTSMLRNQEMGLLTAKDVQEKVDEILKILHSWTIDRRSAPRTRSG